MLKSRMLNTMLLLFCVLIFSPHRLSVEAQTVGQQFYDGSGTIANLSWHPDSHEIYFQEQYAYERTGVSPQYGLPSWLIYNLETQTLSRTETWPLQPQLTHLQRQTFNLGVEDDTESFAFVSPDGRYIVYLSQRLSVGGVWPVALADLQTNEHIVFDTIASIRLRIYASGVVADYRVHWATNSAAFILESFTGDQLVTYIDNFTQSVADAQVRILTRGGVELNNQTAIARVAHDISGDGQQVLLTGYLTSFPPELLLWDAGDSQMTRIVVSGRDIFDAKFDQQVEDCIVYIDETGLNRYDLISGEIHPLASDIQLDGRDRAWISPNTRYIVLYDAPFPDVGRLYLYEIDDAE